MKKIKHTYVPLLFSCIMCSIAVNWVAVPNEFAVTGVTGLAMTVQKLTGIHYAAVSYFIALLILVAALIVLGRGEISNIIFLSILYPAVLWAVSHVRLAVVFEEKLIAVALFGLIYGVGSGIAYRIGFSYGGMDTLGKILRKSVFKTWELRTIMLLADSVIMLIMLSAYSLDSLAYSFVGQLIFVNSMNYVIFNWGPKMYEIQIVSDWTEDIESFVIQNIQKSLTLHTVKGGFSGENKVQMDCVCTSAEYIKLKEFITRNDHDCFIRVIPLMYVFGKHADFHKLADENL